MVHTLAKDPFFRTYNRRTLEPSIGLRPASLRVRTQTTYTTRRHSHARLNPPAPRQDQQPQRISRDPTTQLRITGIKECQQPFAVLRCLSRCPGPKPVTRVGEQWVVAHQHRGVWLKPVCGVKGNRTVPLIVSLKMPEMQPNSQIFPNLTY